MSITIVGAGISGLIAANLLKHRDPVVVEAQDKLPNNHSAVLRFRTSVVGDALGIPFRKVSVIKAVAGWRNPVADALAYSRKSGGIMLSNRSVNFASGFEVAERFIAPPDLIERMAERVDVRCGIRFDFSAGPKFISTIPMPDLMGALKYDHQLQFLWTPGVNVRARVDSCDAYVSLYVPDPDLPFSRVSLTGDELIVECPNNDYFPGKTFENEIAVDAANLLGIDPSSVHSIETVRQQYAKINPVDEGERRRFIYHASTETGRAFSLGRFATWRPGLLADDLVNDVRVIDGMIGSRSSQYDAEKRERVK
jgi:hypothetical protein